MGKEHQQLVDSNHDEEDVVASSESSNKSQGPACRKLEHRMGSLHKALSTLEIMTTPWFVWPVFVVSIVVGASAPAITRMMHGAAPVSLASWRHQVSAIALLPGFVWQWVHLSKSERRKALFTELGLYFLCAFALAVHFGTYLWSLSHTSMTHCLFLTSMSPLFVALYTKLLGRTLLTGEIVGVSLGLVGVVILGAGAESGSEDSPTYIGDLVALFSASFLALYLTISRRLRSWMPLFVFQFPVTTGASILLAVGGILLEGWNESTVGEISGPFSWLRKEYFLGTVSLGVGPGILGQAGYSVVVRYSSAFLMPTGLSLQPILGATIGWAVGETSVPRIWTCVGAFVTLIGTLCVSYAGDSNQGKSKAKNVNNAQEEYQHPAAAHDYAGQQSTQPLLQPSEIP